MEVFDCHYFSLTVKVHLKLWHMEFIARAPIFGHSELFFGRYLRELFHISECRTPKWFRRYSKATECQNPMKWAMQSIKSCQNVGLQVLHTFVRCKHDEDSKQRPSFQDIYDMLLKILPDSVTALSNSVRHSKFKQEPFVPDQVPSDFYKASDSKNENDYQSK